MKINGGCYCGQITYEAEIDLEKVRICHCTDCQKFSGTAFRVMVRVPEAQFNMQGTPKIYVKTAESGNKRFQAFCGDCGTALYATEAERPEAGREYGIRLATANQWRQLKPKRAGWGQSQVDWLSEIANLPTVEKQI